IGGSDADNGNDIVVDNESRAYVGGEIFSSSGFPGTGGPYLSHKGMWDVFLARIASDGGALEYCCYIGGTDNDYGSGLAIDNNYRVYVSGYTYSSESEGFPVKGELDSSYNGDADAFVARVSGDGTSLDYCGYIGGLKFDRCKGVAVDSNGRAYVAGYAGSDQNQGFPAIVGPDTSFNGEYDIFVARVAEDGNSLEYCGYIGGPSYDICNSIAVDNSDRAYLTGVACSSEGDGFPVKEGPDITHNGGIESFVARVAADGASLDYCGYIGGGGDEQGYGIAVDSNGRAYVVGGTTSAKSQGFPLIGALDRQFAGDDEDVFVARVAADGNSLEYCGLINGSDTDRSTDIAVDSSGRAYVTGFTYSSEKEGFPVNNGPDSTFGDASSNAFIARVSSDGNSLNYCSYIGGSWNQNIGLGIAVDNNNRVYVVGITNSTETQGFPVKGGPDLSFNGGMDDAFVARIRDPYIDLAVALENPPVEMAAGEKATVTSTVSNIGETLTGKTSAKIYIGSQLISTNNVPKLKPGQNKKLKVKLNIPAVTGSSTIKVEVTPSVEDINLNNNTAENQVKILGPDLTVKTVAPKKALEPGKSGTLTVGIANQTIATAGEFVVRVYRVNGGAALGEKKVSKLKGQQEKALSVKIKVPADFQPNEYIRVEIDADNQVAEENEGNNTRQYPPPAP
ncbi:MAG: SBBP repeat-containing protein, partial [Chitinophagales bacterium]